MIYWYAFRSIQTKFVNNSKGVFSLNISKYFKCAETKLHFKESQLTKPFCIFPQRKQNRTLKSDSFFVFFFVSIALILWEIW